MSARVLRTLAGLAALAALPLAPARAQSQSNFTYNGVVHTSWWWNEYNNFDQPTGVATDSRTQLLTTNANWIAVLVTQYQDTFNSNVIQARTTEMKTPTDASLRFAIQELRAKGAHVMLKPHVDLWNDSGHWRGQIVPTDVNAWFASYTTFITHYAQLAQEEGCEGFVVGTELVMMTGSANQARWNAVIAAVRAVFTGTLAYAANATFPADEFTSVSFWDRVDLIGLDAYFTLTNHADPTLSELTSAWTSNANGENIVAAIQNVSSANQKPVIFTELGYKSVPGANQQPWNSGLGGNYDPTEQANCYDAAFSVWSSRTSFMKGIFWWAWPVPVPQANDLDYNPRNKPAEAVLRRWQGGATAGFSLSASPGSLTVNRGATGASTITVARTGGFAASVAFTVGGLPSGVTASFNPTSTTGTSSTLTFTASSTATTGTTNVTVTGTGSGTPHTANISLTIATPPVPDFSLAASSTSLSVNRAASANDTINITRLNGFTGGVSFAASGLPSGVTASFNPTPATGNSSVLTLTASSAATLGSFTVTVTGTSGTLSHTVNIALTVVNPPVPDFSLAASPTSLSVTRGTSVTDTINVTRLNGFTGGVSLAASGLPSGVTASFNPTPATGNSSVLTLTASATATLGAGTVTVTGTSGTLTHTTTIALTVVNAPTPDFSLAASPTSLAVNQGASGTDTINITRLNGFTGGVTLAASGLPAGVTAGFSASPATGNSSVLTLTASASATTGAATVTVTGTNGALSHTTTIALSVNTGGGGTGGVTVTPVVSANGPWFDQEDIQVGSTGTLTALSITITIQRTGGISHSGQYNTVGGQIAQSNSSTATAITYLFSLAAGQTLGAGNGRIFATQQSGSGTVHTTTGDLYTVTYTTGGTSFTQSGHF